ncbi:MAG: hypothetical protein WCI73_06295 [Phycisphaerae bacterium]
MKLADLAARQQKYFAEPKGTMETTSLNELQTLLLNAAFAHDKNKRRLRMLPVLIFIFLASKARSGTYPGTLELAARFGVTTGAVRKAEDALESAGLLKFTALAGERKDLFYNVLTPAPAAPTEVL